MRNSVRIKRAYQVQKNKLRRSLSMEDGIREAMKEKSKDNKARHKVGLKMPFDEITKSVNPSLIATHLFIVKLQDKKPGNRQ